MPKTIKNKQKYIKPTKHIEKTTKEKEHEESEKLKNILLIHSKH